MKILLLSFLISPFLIAQEKYRTEAILYINNQMVAHPMIILQNKQTGTINYKSKDRKTALKVRFEKTFEKNIKDKKKYEAAIINLDINHQGKKKIVLKNSFQTLLGRWHTYFSPKNKNNYVKIKVIKMKD